MSMGRPKTAAAWGRMIPALALLGALAIHALLYGALTWQVPSRPRVAAETAPPCWMLPPPGVEEGADPGGLRAWAEYERPTALTLADPVHGYSAVLAAPVASPFTADVPWRSGAPVVPGQSGFSPLSLVAPSLPVGAALREEWRFELPAGAVAGVTPVTAPHAVVWRFADGVPLENMPEPPPLELAGALAAGTPTGPSRFTVILEPEAPGRLRLDASCGNARLDRLALNRLATRLWEWEREAVRRHDRPLPDRFAGDTGYRETVEVEWRLAVVPPAAEGGGGT